MSVVLKSFTQEVDLSDPDNVQHFLVFSVPGRKEPLKLPVPVETTKALIQYTYAKSEKVAEAPDEEEEESYEEEESPDVSDDDELDEFGGDYAPHVSEDEPASEDDVPSL